MAARLLDEIDGRRELGQERREHARLVHPLEREIDLASDDRLLERVVEASRIDGEDPRRLVVGGARELVRRPRRRARSSGSAREKDSLLAAETGASTWNWGETLATRENGPRIAACNALAADLITRLKSLRSGNVRSTAW